MPECTKAHLQQSVISNFFWGRTPRTPLSREGGRKVETEIGKGEGKGLEEGKGRVGKGKVG